MEQDFYEKLAKEIKRGLENQSKQFKKEREQKPFAKIETELLIINLCVN